MADPFTVSFSLQNAKATLQVLKYYQRETNDLTLQAFIASLQTSYNSNVGTATPAGMASVPAQSADGVSGSSN